LKRLRGLLPEGTQVAHKTGTSGYENGIAAATNDVGLIQLPDGRHLAIAVLVTDARADETSVEHTIAAIARACYDARVKTTPWRAERFPAHRPQPVNSPSAPVPSISARSA